MKLTKQTLQKIIHEELRILRESDGWPWKAQQEETLEIEGDNVVLRTGEADYYMTPQEFLSMQVPSWNPDVVEIETADMGGKSIGVPKEMWVNIKEQLIGANQ
tara:strand:+ start:659 stop:967 length:309 start_codon:yes stop_codon:yes gene_type:complete